MFREGTHTMQSTVPPSIHFTADSVRMFANPPGATIRCLSINKDSALVEIKDNQDKHIAYVMVLKNAEVPDLTSETVAIASALYWSWWRGEELQGRKHGE